MFGIFETIRAFIGRLAPAALCASLACSASPLMAAPARGPDVEQLLRQVKLTLVRVQTEITARKLPPLDHVEITLQTAIRTTAGGSITFFVISLGDKVSSEQAQTIKVTLKPPAVHEAHIASTADFSRQFAAAIVAVAESVAKSRNEQPVLDLTNLSASIKFTSETTFEGGVGKVQLIPISIDLGGSLEPTSIHEAVLVFKAAGAE